jgi:hypothetical protein
VADCDSLTPREKFLLKVFLVEHAGKGGIVGRLTFVILSGAD